MERSKDILWENSSSDPEVISNTNKLNDIIIDQKWDINKFHTAITDFVLKYLNGPLIIIIFYIIILYNKGALVSKNKSVPDKIPEYLGKFGNQTLNDLLGQILHSRIDETLWNVG